MGDSKISTRQMISIIILFTLGGVLVSGGSNESMNDAWLATIAAMLLILPVILMYCRIVSLYPEMDFFQIINEIFGKVFGKIILALFTVYAFHVGTLTMRSFSEFLQVVSLPETSQLIILILFGAVCMYITKKGIEVLGRFSNLMFLVLAAFFLLTLILSIKDWDTSNIFPILQEENRKRFLIDTTTQTAFPFGEIVLILTLFSAVKREKSSYAIMITGLLIGGGILVLETLRNIFVLGVPTMSLLYYPSYTAVGTINVGDFITRIEVLISGSFLIAGIVKVSVCLSAAGKGLASVFHIKEYKLLLVPITLLMIATATILFKNTLDSFHFYFMYKYYAAIFQVVLPVIIWIGAEIKHAVRRKKATA